MLSLVHHFRSLSLIFIVIKVTESSLRDFKPGKPLTSEEYFTADKLKGNEDATTSEFDSLDEDIISSFMVKNAYSIDNYLWPNAEVPYLLDEDYDEKGRQLIALVFKEIQNKTCVRFIPRVFQKDYIKLVYEKGCSSFVGRLGGPQTVILGRGCYSVGIMTHEIMHTLGFIHEQSRSDRDSYVTIMWENIKEGSEDNFKEWDWYSKRILKEKYDYSSILHYNKYAFSKDPTTRPTVVPNKQNIDIGQRKGLSQGDINKINKAYRCPDSRREDIQKTNYITYHH